MDASCLGLYADACACVVCHWLRIDCMCCFCIVQRGGVGSASV